jgi:outer membrane protein insertion porin family
MGRNVAGNPIVARPARARSGRAPSLNRPAAVAALVAMAVLLGFCRAALAQEPTTAPTIAPTTEPTTQPPPEPPALLSPDSGATGASEQLRGRRVEAVRVSGNSTVSTAIILNLVRTKEGDSFDPATVQEDYQRIYSLRKFSNVEAKVEPTATGVIVVFEVTEQRQISAVNFRGNLNIDTPAIQAVVDVKPGEAIDLFRIALAREAIEQLYHDKNYPFAHVVVDTDALNRTGELNFVMVEGPNVRIRKVAFIGNNSFTADRLKDQINSKSWIFILRAGTLDPNIVDDDVAALRHYYQSKGFFDVRVGRKLIWSPDQTEVQIDFVIDEGLRYIVDQVVFKGNTTASAAELRRTLKLREGSYYDDDVLQRDIRQVVKVYSPHGYIYDPTSNDPDYLRIDAHPVFEPEPGHIELLYDISEGKPFRMGNILVKGNVKSEDKLVLREMHVAPGQTYNSGELADAIDRIHARPYFTSVNITPIGQDPDTRDVLVQVQEAKTASFNVGAGINSDGGVAGNFTYEQHNFDITNWPSEPADIFTDRAFTGAGQDLRISFEPGTVETNASIRFTEPYIFDQPYSFSSEAYLNDYIREVYDEDRLGAGISFGKQFNDVWSSRISFRGESVDVTRIVDPEVRSLIIDDAQGHHTITNIGLEVRRDTTNKGEVAYQGTNIVGSVQGYGLLGGEYTFEKFTVAGDWYKTVGEDLLDRRVVLGVHTNIGYIPGHDAPFFEKFYAGGIQSVRGFEFRGISPRDGPEHDRIGGNFSVTGTVELGFPIIGENLRGVVFTDAGDVEPNASFGTIRTSVGAGVRIVLPVLGRIPIALDVALPLIKNHLDQTQFFSFSVGLNQ